MNLSLSGTIANLTLVGNQCIVVVKDGGGHLQTPVTLMQSNGNYNAMFSSLLLASTKNLLVDLAIGDSGINMIKVHVTA